MAEEIDMGQPTDDDKYVIFKREDWDYYTDPVKMGDRGIDPLGALRRLQDRAIDDGVVIRRQDVFAPPALEMYAQGIATALTVVRLDQAGEPTELTKRLQRIADYFHGQAYQAWADHASGRRKLPD